MRTLNSGTAKWRVARALVATVIATGCMDQPTMKDKRDINYGSNLPQFPVKGDPATVADVPAEKREEEIRIALVGIIARLPEELRQGAREDLERGFVGLPISSYDPEIARLWSRALSLRIAQGNRQRLLAARNAEPVRATITVALVRRLDDSTFRAMVVRRPDDAGIPLLLLPEESATGEDLLRGLQAASRSTRGYKPMSGRTSIIAVRYGAKRKEPSDRMKAMFAKWEAEVAALRQVPKSNLEGYGRARVTMMNGPGLQHDR